MIEVNDLISQFDKDEILKVAGELGLLFKIGDRSSVLMEMILKDIDENGVPDTGECSDLMFEFLVNAEIVDEDGKIIEEVVSGDKTEEPAMLEQEVPECYSYADERDPACNRCKLMIDCMKVRISNRPECFGRLFDRNAEECKVCLEAPFCMKVISKKG